VSYDPYAEKKKAKRELGVGALQRASAARLAFLTSEPRKDSRTLHDVGGAALGDFPAHGRPYARIPEAIYNAETYISADAWKLLCYLIHRGSLSITEHSAVRIDTADAQSFIGRRCTVERIQTALREIMQAKFQYGDTKNEGIVAEASYADANHIIYSLSISHFRYPAPRFAGDTAYVQENRYALVDLRDVRKFSKLRDIRMYIFCQHARRVGQRHHNNERWYSVSDIGALTGAASGKKWGNIEQDLLRPAIFALGKHAGMHIQVVTKHAKSRGLPVYAVKFIVGNRFKDSRHASNAAAERSNRQGRKDRKEFEAKIDVAIRHFDPVFLSQANARYAIAHEKETFDQLVQRVRYLATLDWVDVYHSDRQRARDYSDDGQFGAAVMTEVESRAAATERKVAERRQFELEMDARRAGAADFYGELDDARAAEAAKRKLQGAPEYQDSLFAEFELPEIYRRDPVLDI
jgi:hypothetical protein